MSAGSVSSRSRIDVDDLAEVAEGPAGRTRPALEQGVAGEQHPEFRGVQADPTRRVTGRVQDGEPGCRRPRRSCPRPARRRGAGRRTPAATASGRPGAARSRRRLAAATSTAALTWSLCPWVHITATTRRSPTAARIDPASCAASMTRTSSSSPTSQTLLSTSHSPPSRANVPDVTTFSTRAAIRAPPPSAAPRRGAASPNASSTSPSPIVSDTNASRSKRPLTVEVDQHREVAAGQAVAVPAGLQRAAPPEDLDHRQLQDQLRRRDTHQHQDASQVACVESLLVGLRSPDRLDDDVGAEAASQLADPARRRPRCGR